MKCPVFGEFWYARTKLALNYLNDHLSLSGLLVEGNWCPERWRISVQHAQATSQQATHSAPIRQGLGHGKPRPKLVLSLAVLLQQPNKDIL